MEYAVQHTHTNSLASSSDNLNNRTSNLVAGLLRLKITYTLKLVSELNLTSYIALVSCDQFWPFFFTFTQF